MYKMNNCLILFVLVFGYVNCIYIKSITGPTWFTPGDNVTFNCKWGLEGNGSVDSVKWYKDSMEIYDGTLYSAQNVHRVRFPVRGVEIHSVSTDGSRITLLLDGKIAEGVYRCEVTDIYHNTAVASIQLRLAQERNGSQPWTQSWITAAIQMLRKLADKLVRAFGLNSL